MKNLILFLSLLLFFANCNKPSEPNPKADNRSKIVSTYADMGFVMYSDAVSEAKKLQTEITKFINAPSASGLETCKTAWKASRVPYAQTESYRFYAGPIDGTNGKETYINAWPLDEAAMDYVVGNTVSGIINDLVNFPVISESVLFDNNQKANEESVVTGYHAIEFLLWGQDLSTTGPGNRPYTDFVDGGTNQNQARRRLFLKTTIDLLIKHLEEVASAWAPNASNYRKDFENPANVKVSLAKILVGLGKYTKGEMAGQRISVALNLVSQEDEHDCFSDYTTQDMKTWQIGLVGIYTGKYIKQDGTTVSGYSFSQFAKESNKSIDDNILSKMKASSTSVNSLTLPFDIGISTEPDKTTIGSFVQNLRLQADSYTDLINILDIKKEFDTLNVD